jgi:hypothetical protein
LNKGIILYSVVLNREYPNPDIPELAIEDCENISIQISNKIKNQLFGPPAADRSLLFEFLGTFLSSANLLGFADSKKWLARRLGRGTKPNKRYRDAQPNLLLSHGRC